MAFENVQYTTVPLTQTMGLIDLAVFVALPAFAAQALSDDTTTVVLASVAGFAVIAAIRGVRRYFSLKRSFATAKAHLKKHGIRTDLELRHELAVDSVSGKIVFVAPATMSYQVYDRSDILRCEHQWVTKSNSNGQLSKTKNILVFKTRNAQQPLYKIRLFDHATAELWLARVNAVLNS
ncbi:hypothetical protein [Burkholderia sp. LMU1-1-1.1]|uniref:hypothetical protein n=1 Tax=Burkholderia sp. LMU1-1-1.1 TaxID=3135266 RepID=UPI0034471406